MNATGRTWIGLAVLTAVILNAGCIIPMVRLSREESRGMTWSITMGNERCHLLKLPESWSNLDNGAPPYISTPYEIRRNSQYGTQVLIGAANQAAMGIEAWRSQNYGLDLATSTIARPVAAVEWDKATALPLSAERCLPKGWGSGKQDIQLRGAQTCRCDNKDFPKPGKWDGFPVFSSSHKWLAVNTWNGNYSGSSNRQIGQPVEAFVDVYRVDTAEKTIVLRAHVGAEIDIDFFEGIRWLGDDFLIIPVHQYLEEFLICDLRENPRRTGSLPNKNTSRILNGSLTQSTPMTLVVSGGFSLSNSGTVTATAAGANTTATITLTATTGFTGATALTIGGLPTNATGTFNPTSITGSGTSTLTFVVPATSAGSTYPITVTGTNGSLIRTTAFNLTVKNFTLSAAPTSITATHGGAAVPSTITLTMQGGFTSSVAFTSSGQPSGVTVVFSPTTRTSTGATTMTVTAASAAAKGTYTLTVKGTNSGLVQSTPVTLIVN